jgi:dTDP-4-dehydrorhamnose reductase
MGPSSSRVAVLGASGQLGTELCRVGRAAGFEVIGLVHDEVEVRDQESVLRAVSAARPDIVINSAAFHQVDRCEAEPKNALDVNALGALHAVRAARDLGAVCVYVSTDYVFAGSKEPPRDGRVTPETGYGEDDSPGPINVYGASKLAGEVLTLASGQGALVVRLASLFGVAGSRGKGGNFVETILTRARDKESLAVVGDMYMSPTYAVDAARAIFSLLQAKASGIVHLTNSGACTWHEFACAAIRMAGFSNDVKPTSVADLPSAVRRPANSALYTARLERLIGAPMRPWPEALRAYLMEKGHFRG